MNPIWKNIPELSTAVFISATSASDSAGGANWYWYERVPLDSTAPHDGNGVVAASGDIVSIAAGSGNLVNASGATISVAANLSVDIVGGGDTVTGGSGSRIRIGGNGPAGASNTVNASSSTVELVDASRATVNGNGNTVILGRDDVLVLGGTGNTVDAGAEDRIWLASAAETIAFHADFGHGALNGFTAAGAALDVIQFDRNVFADWQRVLAGTSQSGADTLITSVAGDVLTLANTTSTALTAANFRFV